MNFHKSAKDIEVVDNHILKASLANANGEYVEAEYNLNHAIGNNNGQFEWGGVNFSGSAAEVTFSLEGDDLVPILRATLFDVEGNRVAADINLAERISNENGRFVFD
ncbi:CVNH domain-protein [Corynascus novoguineensis]|uniref:CVNH domain-protein n=1 Tax=Corynascus novoguineensis TaxID=1126955 RepID=A0AAN7HMZ7_9PEZI|nr:CVNH domain-protein [Corynascus novoguineensis]